MTKRIYADGYRGGKNLTLCEYLIHWVKTPKVKVEDWLCAEPRWSMLDTVLCVMAFACLGMAAVLIGMCGF